MNGNFNLNILSVNKFFWQKGGSETVFFGEKKLLESHGHSVVPFSMKDTKNQTSSYSKYFVSNVNYETRDIFEKAKAACNVIFSFEARNQMKKLLANEKIDIAHFHIFQHQISPSVFGPIQNANVPIILTLHDFKPICPTYLLYTQNDICEACKGGKFYHCVLNKCTKNSSSKSLINMIEMYFHNMMGYYQGVDRYIAVSQFFLKKMVEYGFPEEQIVHIPNFIDTTRFSYSRSDQGYALYFGRLSEEKGIDVLLDASSQCPEIPLIIAGTGPEQEELERKSKVLGASHIRFVGFQKDAQLKKLILDASFSILPSKWYENCPMSVLESLAVGTPVIGSRIGGIPELIREGVDGLNFEPNSSFDLAEKMRSLWSNPKGRTEMGQNGARKISDTYTPEKHYERLVQEYKRVLN